MKERLIATGRYTARDLAALVHAMEIDDRDHCAIVRIRRRGPVLRDAIGAEIFSLGIRVPTLLIQAKDDSFIPFGIFSHPAIAANPHISLLATEHGGHLGFISETAPRFWVDRPALEFNPRPSANSCGGWP